MGPGMALAGYRVVPLPTHPSSHTPGTPSHYGRCDVSCPQCQYGGVNSVVGLRSVAQLTLSARISGFTGMTEVYNLVYVGRTNNHSFILGNK